MMRRFRFRWVPFVATVLLVALGIALGNWQERRAAQKIALQAKLAAGNAAAPLRLGTQPVDAAALEFHRVSVRGQFVANWALYLDNRPYQGRAGFYLLMPMRIEAPSGDGAARYVLVKRGWLPADFAEHTRIPAYATPAGTVTIEGIARLNAGHVMQLGQAPALAPNAIVQNVDIGEFGAASGLAMQPLVIEQTTADVVARVDAGAGVAAGREVAGGQAPPASPVSAREPAPMLMPARAASGIAGAAPAALAGAAAAPLLRDWPPPALGVERHQGYAFQWYALALMAFLFFVVTGFKRGKPPG